MYHKLQGCEILDKSKIKGYLLVSAFTVLLYLGLTNLDALAKTIRAGLSLFMPFILGMVIAFVLNYLLCAFEEKLYRPVWEKYPRAAKFKRPISLVSTYLILIIGISVLLVVVIPQLATSIVTLANNVPSYLNSLQKMVEDLITKLNIQPQIWEQLMEQLNKAVEWVLQFIIDAMPRMINLVISVSGGVMDTMIAMIVSIYLLLSKEKLVNQVSMINRAFLPQPAARQTSRISRVIVETFGKYVTGQITDALIIGVVSVIGLSILQFPYAMLIGVVMGITNVIPFFGPFIGAVPGFFIILMIDPLKAVWYILFVVIVQQIDGNIIAPKIIGESVGLPPLWVLFSVTVGGGLFGVLGMILGTPVFAVIYRLIREAVYQRAPSRQSPEPEKEV